MLVDELGDVFVVRCDGTEARERGRCTVGSSSARAQARKLRTNQGPFSRHDETSAVFAAIAVTTAATTTAVQHAAHFISKVSTDCPLVPRLFGCGIT